MGFHDYLLNLKNTPIPQTAEEKEKLAKDLLNKMKQETSYIINYEDIPVIKELLINMCHLFPSDVETEIEKYYRSMVGFLIEEKDIISLPSMKKYIVKNNGEIYLYDFNSLSSLYPHEINYKNKREFDKIMTQKNRIKTKIVYKIPTAENPVLDYEYNVLVLKFLEPKPGPEPWFIDLIIQTLTGGEVGGAESMTRTILRKFRHPQDRQIPWFIFSDQGGTGKGVLFEKILTKIFGENVSNHNLSFDRMSSRFGDLRGMLCALVNEAPSHKTDMDFLKSIVWESQYISEQKYQEEVKIDLYIWGGITSNPRNGKPTIIPTGHDEDRRWSFFSVDTDCDTLLKAVQRRLVFENLDQARIWLSENIEEYTNEDHVASWLHQKLNQYEDTPAVAFHGKYYENLLSNSRDIIDLLCEIVFNDPNFIYISENDFFGLYQQFCELNGVNYQKTRPNFVNEIKRKMISHDVNHARCNLGLEKVRLNCFKKGLKSTFPNHNQIYQKMICDLSLFQEFLGFRGY